MKMKRLFYLLTMVCILLTSCSFQEQPEEEGLPPVTVSGGSIYVPQNVGNHMDYNWANSVGIYRMKDDGGIIQYNRDGELIDEAEVSEVCSYSTPYIWQVDDTGLYFYLWDEENSWWFYRIPFTKNKNGQIVLDYENKDRLYDTSNMWKFDVVGNYFVGLTKYQQVLVIMNIENKREKKFKKLPESLRYFSESDEYWAFLANGEDWVMWRGNGLFLQKIPSNEIIRLETKKNIWYNAAYEMEKKNIVCFDKDKCKCKSYNFDGTSKLVFDKAAIKNIIGKMVPGKMEIEKCKIDNIIKRKERFYLQIKYRKKKEKWTYALLVYDNTIGKFLCGEERNNCLPPNKLFPSWWEMPEDAFLGIYEDDWYFKKGEEAYLYNEEFKTFKVIRKGDPEWNCFYAVNSNGLEEFV